jgi:hypothetical protein
LQLCRGFVSRELVPEVLSHETARIAIDLHGKPQKACALQAASPTCTIAPEISVDLLSHRITDFTAI